MQNTPLTFVNDIYEDLENPGSIWVNEPVVVDVNRISSRTPRNLAPFSTAMV